jgi:hypothetical protein
VPETLRAVAYTISAIGSTSLVIAGIVIAVSAVPIVSIAIVVLKEYI